MADFPADVFVRGAWRVDAATDDHEDGDDEYGSDAVEHNQTNRLVPWKWVVAIPTTLRTSLGYSKVSSSSFNKTSTFSSRFPPSCLC